VYKAVSFEFTFPKNPKCSKNVLLPDRIYKKVNIKIDPIAFGKMQIKIVPFIFQELGFP